MNVLSLFAGIGGMDLGLERAGMTVVGQVEIDPFCRSVLAHHYPEVPRHDDVRTTVPWWESQSRPHVDLVAGGFPCQPVSLAGLGLAQEDERWLWPAMLDVIRAVGPEWVLWENVPGLRTRGLDIVHADLVRLGYRHRVGRIRACEVGAPQARARLLGVAHAPRLGRGTRRPGGPAGEAAHRHDQPPQGLARRTTPTRTSARHWASEPRVDRLVDGLSRELAEHHLRAYGNAIVPGVAEHVGRLIANAHALSGASTPSLAA
ncbi:DNA cytosine methyltransferase [Amycolatopsis keratiniphila]|uniref:DNA (cytosine-5-)-methyltransferase n=1 Tax=Amycolatopsis keratiniphila TaxID=129921 RepID=R4TD23_9PSEU|nr:DNA cytosine methyltransferase [Amycolatopsis keratiniphila]AGM10141.1 DNA (cytosine-5-)-methyltransferase [Amycolatopsis keratiniphila]